MTGTKPKKIPQKRPRPTDPPKVPWPGPKEPKKD